MRLKQGTQELKKQLAQLGRNEVEIPLIIGGRKCIPAVRPSALYPHRKDCVIGTFHMAGEHEVQEAIAALAARKEWESMPWEHRAAIFLKAAEIIAGPRRSIMNAGTMLCQSKTAHQSEIDVVCELADMLRFNTYFMNEIYTEQPISARGAWNRMEYRALEGFVLAVTPFNFTSIAGNLPTSAAIAGNAVLWKPASTAVYSSYQVMQVLRSWPA